MSGWIEAGGPVEKGRASPQSAPRVARRGAFEDGKGPAAVAFGLPAARPRSARSLPRTSGGIVALFDALAVRSVGQILAAWLGMVVVFGLLYWLAEVAMKWGGLAASGTAVPGDLGGLATAMYFSFVTATSVGYGDVVPVGFVRVLAMIEAASGLLIFGFVISKFLSRRQEEMLEEVHRIAFEDRLGRVQTNLHLVLSELQTIAAECRGSAAPTPGTLARAESAVMVFSSELRTIHDMLFRPQQTPGEEVLEAILASLAAVMGTLQDLVACMPESARRSSILRSNLASTARYASEICGECVPRDYAPPLKEWMDRIQEASRTLSTPTSS